VFLFIILTLTPFAQSVDSITFDLNQYEEDIRILGEDNYDRFGGFIAIGDFNNDGKDDMLIGAHGAETEDRFDCGMAYVIFGKDSFSSEIDLNSASADITIVGDRDRDLLGHEVASGDINGDGFDDIIIGSTAHDSFGITDAGRTYVIYGKSNFPQIVDLRYDIPDIIISGESWGVHCAKGLSTGDINNDNYDDILIGATFSDFNGKNDAGKCFVFFGSELQGPGIYLNSSDADIIIYGEDSLDQLGMANATGDINNDGYDDIIVGSPQNKKSDCRGKIYIIFGSNTAPRLIDLGTQNADITIEGEEYGSLFGRGVGSGDVNNDGFDDVIVGAIEADALGKNNSGKIYVIFGGNSIPSNIQLFNTSADIEILAKASGDMLGHTIISKDIDSDSYDDIICGSGNADPFNRMGAGEAYAILGSSTLPSIIDLSNDSVSITVHGDDPGDRLGIGLNMGDFDGNNKNDLIVGAEFTQTPTGSEVGSTFIMMDITEKLIMHVNIDIKPGSDPNSINLNSKGKIPVAVLSSDIFDAATIDPATVSLAGAPVIIKRNGSPMASLEDVNIDGYLDLVLHYDMTSLLLEHSDTEADLEGLTYDGRKVKGTDSIRIVGKY
jgi:hypothetical protein